MEIDIGKLSNRKKKNQNINRKKDNWGMKKPDDIVLGFFFFPQSKPLRKRPKFCSLQTSHQWESSLFTDFVS